MRPLERRGELVLRTRKDGLMVEAWGSVNAMAIHFGGATASVSRRIEQKGWLAHTMPGARRVVPRACRRLLHTKASGTDASPIQHHVGDTRESTHVPPATP
jgi:hypothetical protein